MRNHAVQYSSEPDFGWYKLRRSWPSVYESHADLAMETWTKLRIEVAGRSAKLYLNGSAKPSLVIDGMKGEDLHGGVGLWSFTDEEAYFSNVRITPAAPQPIKNGSDAAGSMRTRAEKRGDTYVLNGNKIWITQGSVADVICVFAVTDPGKGPNGISAFVVEKTFPGFKVGKLEKKMGIRGSPTCELIFENCVVPAENLLGEEGTGFKTAMKVLDKSRPGIAAQALGIAEGALDYAAGYAQERMAFGKPIGQQQGIQFMLADMKVEVEASRLLLYEAARKCDESAPDLTLFAALAKLKAGDTAMKVTTDAVQILGGFGYSTEYPLERMMRDAKITQIYEGTQQIQRLVIARTLVGKWKPPAAG